MISYHINNTINLPSRRNNTFLQLYCGFQVSRVQPNLVESISDMFCPCYTPGWQRYRNTATGHVPLLVVIVSGMDATGIICFILFLFNVDSGPLKTLIPAHSQIHSFQNFSHSSKPKEYNFNKNNTVNEYWLRSYELRGKNNPIRKRPLLACPCVTQWKLSLSTFSHI